MLFLGYFLVARAVGGVVLGFKLVISFRWIALQLGTLLLLFRKTLQMVLMRWKKMLKS